MELRLKTIDLCLKSSSRGLHDDTPRPYLNVTDHHDLAVRADVTEAKWG